MLDIVLHLRKQQAGETYDAYLEELGSLPSQRMIIDATTEQVEEDAIRDAFNNWLS